MKIRLWDRLILLFGVLFSLLAGPLFLFVGIRLCMQEAAALAPLWSTLCLIAGTVSILLGGLFFILLRRFSCKHCAFVVQHTDNGELRIAVSAIRNLVQKCIDMHEEIHVNQMNIRHSREGVTVDLSIALANNISIPLAVASLQKQIKQYLVASSGIDVKEVKVCVESTQSSFEETDSPYLVPAADSTVPVAPAEIPVKEKKVPLHRRLFSKADQAATMPEPPKPEQADEEAVPAEDAAEEIKSTENSSVIEATEETAVNEAVQADTIPEEAEKEDNSLG